MQFYITSKKLKFVTVNSCVGTTRILRWVYLGEELIGCVARRNLYFVPVLKKTKAKHVSMANKYNMLSNATGAFEKLIFNLQGVTKAEVVAAIRGKKLPVRVSEMMVEP